MSLYIDVFVDKTSLIEILITRYNNQLYIATSTKLLSIISVRLMS